MKAVKNEVEETAFFFVFLVLKKVIFDSMKAKGILLLLLVVFLKVNAQTDSLKNYVQVKVIDATSKEPLFGCFIRCDFQSDTNVIDYILTHTNIEGTFNIERRSTMTIRITCEGYNAVEITIEKDKIPSQIELTRAKNYKKRPKPIPFECWG